MLEQEQIDKIRKQLVVNCEARSDSETVSAGIIAVLEDGQRFPCMNVLEIVHPIVNGHELRLSVDLRHIILRDPRGPWIRALRAAMAHDAPKGLPGFTKKKVEVWQQNFKRHPMIATIQHITIGVED
jgi:hypothetical protein